MEITNEQINGATIIHLSGRFDAYAAPAVEVFFQKIGTDLLSSIIVNLSNVNFIDSTGLATLILGMRRCRQQQGDLILCGIQQAVRIIFEVTCLDKVLTIASTQEEAIAKFRTQQAG